MQRLHERARSGIMVRTKEKNNKINAKNNHQIYISVVPSYKKDVPKYNINQNQIKNNPEKIKINSNPENAVAYGATLDLIKKVENNKIKFNLVDTVGYNLGIENINNLIQII